MKRKLVSIFTAIIGIVIVGCSSSEPDPYSPDVNKGDYVTVVALLHKDYDQDQKLTYSELQEINFDNTIKPTSILVYDKTKPTPLPVKLYTSSFTYSDAKELISISVDTVNGKEGIDLKYDVLRNGSYITEFENREGEGVRFEYLGSNIVKSVSEASTTSYRYDSQNNLVGVSSEHGVFEIAYNEMHNPFVQTQLNLYLRYIPGAKDIELLNRSSKAIASITNITTGEKIDFKYELDQFKYPVLMQGFIGERKVSETVFTLRILRAQE